MLAILEDSRAVFEEAKARLRSDLGMLMARRGDQTWLGPFVNCIDNKPHPFSTDKVCPRYLLNNASLHISFSSAAVLVSNNAMQFMPL